MTALRILLAALLAILVLYTLAVLAEEGFTLFQVFFGDIARGGWPGQFNLDFLMMLTLSALWTAWRGGFSPGALGLALLAFTGGALFLTIFLLVLSVRTGGDVRRMLLGVHA